MADIEKNVSEEMEDFDLENMVTMIGDDGKEYQFEVLDVIEYCGHDYVVLLGEGENEVSILQIEPCDDDEEMESYTAIEDEDILQAVFDIFKENNKDIFDFAD